VLTKLEMYHGLSGWLLWKAGQVPVDRNNADPRAVKICLKALRGGRAIGIFPEGTRGAGNFTGQFHRGAAYLALVSGAPVVPVLMLGTREPGGGSGSLPKPGGGIDIVYGEPWHTGPVGWPRTAARVRDASSLLREHMTGELDRAHRLTGRQSPGPLPAAGLGAGSGGPETGGAG
jgi:1-acyl-sn-glycerol-3-phosphate acyltransferase